MTENYDTTTKAEKTAEELDKEAPEKEKEGEGEKLFTQQQVEKLLSERIKRERKNNEALIPVRQLIKRLSEEGNFKGKSYGEIAGEIINRFSDGSRENDDNVRTASEGETSGEQNKTEQTDFSRGGETSDVNAHSVAAEEGGEKNDDAEKHVGDRLTGEKTAIELLCSFKEKYPDADMNKIFEGGMFKRFAKGKEGSIYEICEDYCSFLSELHGANKSHTVYGEDDFSERENERAGRISSTGFSAYSGSDASCGAELTKQQMEIAESAGISYREYAELLSSIPKRKGKQVK